MTVSGIRLPGTAALPTRKTTFATKCWNTPVKLKAVVDMRGG